MTLLLDRRPGLLVLIDPSRTPPADAVRMGVAARDAGAAAPLIGSSFHGTRHTHAVPAALRAAGAGAPPVLVPGPAMQRTDHGDLVLVPSLQSSPKSPDLIDVHL